MNRIHHLPPVGIFHRRDRAMRDASERQFTRAGHGYSEAQEAAFREGFLAGGEAFADKIQLETSMRELGEAGIVTQLEEVAA